MKHKIENAPSLMLMAILSPPKELDNPQTIGQKLRNQRVEKGLQVEEKFSSRGETYFADKVSIGGEVEESAALNIEAEDKGILVPRLTTVQMEAISNPATGLIVYNTDEVAFMYWTGSDWIAIGGSESKIITRVLTANVVNTSQTPAEIIGLSFEAEPNSTYIITGGLNIMFSNGTQAHAGISIPSGSLSCTFIGKKNPSYDSMFSYININGDMVPVQKSNREGHVGVYAVVTTGATGGTVMFRHVNYGASGSVTTIAKSFIKAFKHS